jgi:hypothetical protein
MKWFLFTGACVAALVVLGILAVDERDVVWEDRKPVCGYCRADLRAYAVVCPDCNRSLDWVSHREDCGWCLDREDADELRDLFEQVGADTEPLPGGLAEFPIAYFLTVAEGTCLYCGGIGTIVEADAKVPCVVCRGDKRCVGCAGDRVTVRGDEDAHRRALERLIERRRALERSEMTDRPLIPSRLVDEDVKALRGHVEADQLADGRGRSLRKLAHDRLARAFKALHEELQRTRTQGGTHRDE